VASGECSGDSDREVQFTFTNTSAIALEVFWVDWDCNEVSYGVIQPGEFLPMITYDTHLWVIRDEAGNFIGEHRITPTFNDIHLDVASTISVQAEPVQGPSGTCSGDSDQVVDFTITNTTANPVEVFWVGWDCNEVSYAVVQPGEAVPMSSYATHVWVIRDQAGNFISEQALTPETTDIQIQ
jgi:hypothetical protein